jgi:hypothetical protein
LGLPQDQASRLQAIIDGGAWSAPSMPLTPSWFYVPPMEFTMGPRNWLWSIQFYGFAELDVINDSTQGFNEGLGNGLIPRNELLSPTGLPQLTPSGKPAPNPAGMSGRTQLSARNSRLGVKLSAPEMGGIKSSALLEMDFFGVQPPDGTYSAIQIGQPNTEFNLMTSGTFHMRHAYLKLENDYVSILAGQTYDVFGFQNYFFPATTELVPMPNQVFARNPQVRFYHTFKTDPIDIDVVAAAVRPPQRDSEIPSGEGGLLFKANHWKGIHTPGALGTTADPMALGVSGTVREFRVNNLEPIPAQYATDTGWGLSADALIPVIPAVDSSDRSNKLTLTGSFSMGTAYQDLVGNMTMGLSSTPYPSPPGTTAFSGVTAGTAAVADNQTTYPAADIDPGLLVFDYSGNGLIHTINLRTWMAGFQYYLPGGGRFIFAGNYTHAESNNIVNLIGGAAISPPNGIVVANPAAQSVIQASNYADATLFFDILANARIGATASLLWQTYADRGPPNQTTTAKENTYEIPAQSDWPPNEVVRNIRYRVSFYYYF